MGEPPFSARRRTVQSLRTNWMPCPGYTVDEQNQHFSKRMAGEGGVGWGRGADENERKKKKVSPPY